MLLWVMLGCYVSADERQAAYDRDEDGQVAMVLGGTDCDDSNPDVYLGAFESCLDGIDSDCDGELCPLRTDISLDSIVPYAAGEVGEQFGTFGAILDFSGDGIDDLILSIPQGGEDLGMVVVVPGPLGDDDLEERLGEAMFIVSDEYAELHLDTVLDMDGDGLGELILTATDLDPNYGTQARNIHFRASAFEVGEVFTSELSARLTGGEWQDYEEFENEPEIDYDELFIGGVDNVGDQDGDGSEDLFIRAPYNGYGGVALLITSDLDGSGAQGSAVASIGVERGTALALLGEIGGRGPDINGDGIAEIIVGTSDFDLPIEPAGLYYEDVGGIFLFEGPLQGALVHTDASFRISGSYAEAPLADATSIGDTDGDGYEELGVYIRSGGGDIAIFRTFDEDDPLYLAQSSDVYLYGGIASEITSEFGEAMISYDVDQDGLNDLIVSAPTEPTLDGWAAEGLGSTYLFYGPVSGVQSPDHAAARWQAGQGDWLLAPPMVGDLDADKRADLVLPYVGDLKVEGHLYFLSDAFSGL
ncbi:MAG: hypothetical protein ACI8S6_002144 [Myxococcota bacterium]|jgi:hypothetical protein